MQVRRMLITVNPQQNEPKSTTQTSNRAVLPVQPRNSELQHRSPEPSRRSRACLHAPGPDVTPDAVCRAGDQDDSAGPVLVRHAAVGRDGRRFDVLRFRTAEYEPNERAAARTQKATQLGQFLR